MADKYFTPQYSDDYVNCLYPSAGNWHIQDYFSCSTNLKEHYVVLEKKSNSDFLYLQYERGNNTK